MAASLAAVIDGEGRRHYFKSVVFIIGTVAMSVASFFLIDGLSQFSGGVAAQRMLIVAGVLFQITESLCFISAAAFTAHSKRWRAALFVLGSVLFCFSIGVMTLAQKAALGVGEATATAIDEQRQQLRAQINSLDELIAGYRANAAKQSQSIYAASRALGEDSLNNARTLETKKLTLAQQLFTLPTSRRQTSLDFFNRLHEVTGLPAKQTEFWFLFLRSLLLELSGIFLMSFGAHLHTLEHGQNIPKRKATTTQRNRKREKPASRDPGPVQTKATSVQFAALTPDPTQGAKEKVSYLRPVKPDSVVQNVNKDIVGHAEKIITLYTAKKLPSLAQKRIITALREYFDISVGSSTAREIQKLVKDLITQPNSTAEQPHKLIVTTD